MGQDKLLASSIDKMLEVVDGKLQLTRLVNEDANLKHIGQDGQCVLTSTSLGNTTHDSK